jgi:hypothetical protein
MKIEIYGICNTGLGKKEIQRISLKALKEEPTEDSKQ